MSFFGSPLQNPNQAWNNRLAQSQAALAQQQAQYNQAMLGQSQNAMAAVAAAQAQQNAYTTPGGLIPYNTTGNTGTTYSGTTPGYIRFTTSSNSTTTTGATTYQVAPGGYVAIDDGWEVATLQGPIKVLDGQAKTIELPDGTRIEVAKDGSFTIHDKDAKVTYRANRVRDFNQFINVSDRLEEFIKFCGEQGVQQGEMLELPLNLFIGWLVIQAAKADKEPEPDIKLLPDLRKRAQPRCPGCGRFTLAGMRAKRLEFCAPPCFQKHYDRVIPKLPAPTPSMITVGEQNDHTRAPDRRP